MARFMKSFPKHNPLDVAHALDVMFSPDIRFTIGPDDRVQVCEPLTVAGRQWAESNGYFIGVNVNKVPNAMDLTVETTFPDCEP